MSATIKKLAGSIVEVKSETPADVFDRFIASATKQFIKNTEIKGFRKGNAPEKLVLQQIGEHIILERAAELALGEIWPKVIAEKKINAIGRPKFQILKLARGNPLEWRATVAVLPDIALPDYKTIARAAWKEAVKKPIEVEEKEIDDAVGWLQKSRAKKGEKPPELNDTFAKSLGNFPTLTALREHIRNNIEQEKKLKERDRMRVVMLEAIVKKTDIDIPKVLIAFEQEKILEELKVTVERIGQKWSAYLTQTKKSEEGIKNDFAEEAKRRASFGLVLKAIADAEHIKAADDEIAARVEMILAQYPENERANLDQRRLKEYAYGVIMNEKAFQALEKDGDTLEQS